MIRLTLAAILLATPVFADADSESTVTAEIDVFSHSENNFGNGHKTTTVRNVPSVSAPGIVTAHNCALPSSGSIVGAGAGISLGSAKVDETCQLINEAAALNVVAGASTAVLHLARDPEMCQTLRSAGKISAGALCTKDERAAADNFDLGFTKCYLKANGNISIKYKSGANKAAAQRNCLASLK